VAAAAHRGSEANKAVAVAAAHHGSEADKAAAVAAAPTARNGCRLVHRRGPRQ
jgi:hypothetical protein